MDVLRLLPIRHNLCRPLPQVFVRGFNRAEIFFWPSEHPWYHFIHPDDLPQLRKPPQVVHELHDVGVDLWNPAPLVAVQAEVLQVARQRLDESEVGALVELVERVASPEEELHADGQAGKGIIIPQTPECNGRVLVLEVKPSEDPPLAVGKVQLVVDPSQAPGCSSNAPYAPLVGPTVSAQPRSRSILRRVLLCCRRALARSAGLTFMGVKSLPNR